VVEPWKKLLAVEQLVVVEVAGSFAGEPAGIAVEGVPERVYQS